MQESTRPLDSVLHGTPARVLITGAVFLVFAVALFVPRVSAQQYERGRWSAPPDFSGLNDSVLSIAFDPSGNLYVGGYFTDAGGNGNADRVAMWDGKRWNALGSGFNKSVQALAADSKGSVYAGGIFWTTGDAARKFGYIARWDGTQWSDLAYGLNAGVLALAVDPQDRLYAAGDFTGACRDSACSTTVPAMHVARWTGSQWESLGSGLDRSVNAIALDGQNNLYAGGDFSRTGALTGDLPHIARWDGSSWTAPGGGVSGSILTTVHSVAVDGIGNLYVSGRFAKAGPVLASRVAKWDGDQWSTLDAGTNFATYALITDVGGALYAGGLFTEAGHTTAEHVAKWDPRAAEWSELGGGLDNTVFAFAYSPQSILFAGGDFVNADGDNNADRIAQWVAQRTAIQIP